MGFGPPAVAVVDFVLDGAALSASMPEPDGMAACAWAAADDWLSLFPGALPADQAAYWSERLEDPDDGLELAAVRALAWQFAEQVYAVPWWAAYRLCSAAAANWLSFESWAVSAGFDPRGCAAARIVAGCWSWRLACLDPEQKDAAKELEAEVFAAPEGFAVSEAGHEAKLARNRATFAQLGGGLLAPVP
ncbi:hypothetical protein [Streptacidiphilus cavernicola]|uniref:DUF4240 domain-containing protein n=1 Tax=Streptacidiphilus cavernicola TaxID=3342716 RepID=A0ABV6VYV9_9ACTN